MVSRQGTLTSPPPQLTHVVTKAKCYVKREDDNTEKNVSYVKDHIPNTEMSYHSWNNNQSLPVKDKRCFMWKCHGKLHALNTRYNQIWKEIIHLYDIHAPSSPEEFVMGHESNRWCKFHKVKVHHTKYCYQLKKEIIHLIQEGHHKKYIKGDSFKGQARPTLTGVTVLEVASLQREKSCENKMA